MISDGESTIVWMCSLCSWETAYKRVATDLKLGWKFIFRQENKPRCAAKAAVVWLRLGVSNNSPGGSCPANLDVQESYSKFTISLRCVEDQSQLMVAGLEFDSFCLDRNIIMC